MDNLNETYKSICMKKVYEKIIEKYQLVIKYRSQNLSDEVIEMKYKLRSKIIEAQYFAIPANERQAIIQGKTPDTNDYISR